MTPAPIILFTYKRLDVLKQTIDALKNNYLASESDLFLFSDGPKNSQDELIISEIRLYLSQISGFKSIHIIESKINKGLANSIIEGVSWIIDKFESAIVLEDDLITSVNFLLFMNASLEAYHDKENVFSISGYSFNLGNDPEDNNDAYFLNRGWSWGWATWKNRWQKVDWEVKNYNEFLADRKAKKAFAKGGSDLNKMLEKQMTDKLDSWAIRWFYHQFYIGGLTAYPIFSKIYNAGFDKDATHTTGSNRRYIPVMDTTDKKEFELPKSIQLSNYYSMQFQRKMSVLSRMFSKLNTYVKKLRIV
jgi:hypothetical protein